MIKKNERYYLEVGIDINYQKRMYNLDIPKEELPLCSELTEYDYLVDNTHSFPVFNDISVETFDLVTPKYFILLSQKEENVIMEKEKFAGSVFYDEQELINTFLKLFAQGKDIQFDPTFSKGVIHKNRKLPNIRSDISDYPNLTFQADVRKLPLEDNSIQVTYFDPPFLSSTGDSLNKEKKGSNIMLKRFDYYRTNKELFQMYYDALKELYRVCSPNGLLIMKCQDKVLSRKQYLSHCEIYNYARNIGWYVEDIAILVRENRMMSGKWKNQEHLRKYHCYYYAMIKKTVNLDLPESYI